MNQPLDETEKLTVYLAQVHLGATKICLSCDRVLRVADFAAYGRHFCWECTTRTGNVRRGEVIHS